MISPRRNNNLLPKLPPGCDNAKSSAVKPRAFNNATARASPITNVAVVLEVGANPNGQASCETFTHTWVSASLASVESGLPVMAMSFAPIRLSTGIMASTSPVSPELDMVSTTSSKVIMPRSPWLASPG